MPKNIEYLSENYKTSFGTDLRSSNKEETIIPIQNMRYLKSIPVVKQDLEAEKIKKSNETDISFSKTTIVKENQEIYFKEEFTGKNLINIVNSYSDNIKKQKLIITPNVSSFQKSKINFSTIKEIDVILAKKLYNISFKKINYTKEKNDPLIIKKIINDGTIKEKSLINIKQTKILNYTQKIDFSNNIKIKKNIIGVSLISKMNLSNSKVAYKDSFTPITDAIKSDNSFQKTLTIIQTKIKNIYYNPSNKATTISSIAYSNYIKEKNKQEINNLILSKEDLSNSKVAYKDSFTPITDAIKNSEAFIKTITKTTLYIKPYELSKLYTSYKDNYKIRPDGLKTNSNFSFDVQPIIINAIKDTKIIISSYEKSVVSSAEIFYSDHIKENNNKQVIIEKAKTRNLEITSDIITIIDLTDTLKYDNEKYQEKFKFTLINPNTLTNSFVSYKDSYRTSENTLKKNKKLIKNINIPRFVYKIIPLNNGILFNNLKSKHEKLIPKYKFNFIPLENINLNLVDNYRLVDNNAKLKGNSSIYKIYTKNMFIPEYIQIAYTNKEINKPTIIKYTDTLRESYNNLSPQFIFKHSDNNKISGVPFIRSGFVDSFRINEPQVKKINPKDLKADIFMYNVIPYSLSNLSLSNLKTGLKQLGSNNTQTALEGLIKSSSAAYELFQAGMNLKYLTVDEMLLLSGLSYSTLALMRGIKVKEFLFGLVPTWFKPDSIAAYKTGKDGLFDSKTTTTASLLIKDYKGGLKTTRITPSTSTDIKVFDGNYQSSVKIKDVYNFIKKTYRDQIDKNGEGTFKKIIEGKTFYYERLDGEDYWKNKEQERQKIKVTSALKFFDSSFINQRLTTSIDTFKKVIDETKKIATNPNNNFDKLYNDFDLSDVNINITKPVNSWEAFLSTRSTIYDLGYIAVFPTNEPTKNYKIPFQFNPKITEGGITANYAATTFLGRTGAIQTYVNTSALTSATIDFSYHITTDKINSAKASRNQKQWDWLDNFDQGIVQSIESLLRSLTLPTFKVDDTNKNSFEFSPPPLIRVMFGASANEAIHTNIFTYPANKKFKINDKSESFFRNFVVTQLTINKDLDAMPLIINKDETRGVGSFVADTAGFNVQLSLVEVTPNYKDILPDYNNYYNDGRTLFDTDAGKNKFVSFGPK